jgi:GTP-binding protein LepA
MSQKIACSKRRHPPCLSPKGEFGGCKLAKADFLSEGRAGTTLRNQHAHTTQVKHAHHEGKARAHTPKKHFINFPIIFCTFAGSKTEKLRMKNIRNFCIIAHIDHGKSTLADRLLETTKTIADKDQQAQVLDSMDLERERGITIKSHAIQMIHSHEGEVYTLNLIDTPGHVDFSYEVSRSIAACEGALLIVDATQGIQAQTISNLYMAIEHDLEIIPVMNKMDMDSAMPDEVEDQIVDLLGCKPGDIIRASGKTGMGVEEILEAIINRIPEPKGDPDAPLQCLIFDSVFNSFRGIIAYFKIENGTMRKGDLVKFVATGKEYNADEIGILRLDMIPQKEMSAGNVGYIISGIKTSKEVKVGDTITHVKRPCEIAIDGFEEVKPMVFAGVYPIDTEDFEDLRSAIEKLQLNDASLTFEPESSVALGFGFRCGFLGMLHMEIVQERLDREFDMNVITTVPNVSYKVYTKKEELLEVHNPSGLPDIMMIERIEEPYIRASIITRTDYIGQIMTLCLDKRGDLIKQEYISGNRMELVFDLPLGEIVFDFYDRLKSISKGYASFDYHMNGYRPSKLVKLDILLNGEPVDALSSLIHVDNAVTLGRRMCEKLKELIPRQQFDIAIQAAIGAKIISRETIKAVRKDVTAKCYGGDISRKRKLLEKQKKGKKRMKQIGNVEVPQKAFLAVLKLD